MSRISLLSVYSYFSGIYSVFILGNLLERASLASLAIGLTGLSRTYPQQLLISLIPAADFEWLLPIFGSSETILESSESDKQISTCIMPVQLIKKIETEEVLKMHQAITQEGISEDNYKRIIDISRADEEFRKKLIGFINEERQKS